MVQAFYKNEVNMDELIKEEVALLRNMNFAEEYIKGCYENCKKWNVTGLLRGIKDPFIARQVSELLENQRLWNEQYDQDAQWKRCSIPVIRRVFNQDFLGFHLVSIQAARKPEDFIYFVNEDLRVRSAPSPVRTRFVALPWEGPKATKVDENGRIWSSEYKGQTYVNVIDGEAEATLDYSAAYAHEINKEIVNDLLAICDNKDCVYQSPEQLFSLVEGMSAYIGTKTPNEATWIVAHPKVCELLKPSVGERWKLYEFDVPQEKILLGYKNPKNHYVTGYIYSPYLPFMMTEKGVLIRYNKKLVNASFYGSITLSNFGEDTLDYNEGEGEE
jgi:hypothetical protein